MEISLALGGGGAKGNAHIGVIRRLEKLGFRIRAIAGTSFGGIVAVLYALGYSIDEIEDRFASVDQKRLLGRPRRDEAALMSLARVDDLLASWLGEHTFADTRIPCAVTSVDVRSGSEVVLSSGRLKDALLSTIALPAIFPAFTLDDLLLVDGGVLDPVPVSVARSLAPRLPVVAVVLTVPGRLPAWHVRLPVPRRLPRLVVERLEQTRLARVFDLFMRSVEIGSHQIAELRLRLEAPEVVIRPAVENIELLQVVNVREVARLGERAAEAALPELVKLMPWRERIARRLGAARN